MRRLLFVSFRHRSHARSAVRELERSASADAERSVREHDDGLDPLVAVDLVGCQAQEERERRSILRFLPVFVFFALAGAVIDLFALPTFAGFAATMLLGSIGVAVGTVAVLMDAPQPLELAFRDVDDAFAKGETVLTVPLAGTTDGAAERTLREHGGRTLFDA